MEKIPWYKSNSLRGLLLAGLAFVAQTLGLDDTVNDKFIADLVNNFFSLAEAVGIIWATYARVRLPTPPVSTAAVEATIKRQGGYSSVTLLATLALVATLGIGALTGCANTTAAYKAAKGVDQQAFVVLSHYDALLKEANVLKDKPDVPPEVVDAMKKADAAVYPVVSQVRTLRDAYRRVKSAENEEALQLAVNDAVLLLANFINAIKQARGEQ
jgi:hypothetical protein